MKNIPKLHHWPLETVLIEKYRFKIKEARAFASFLMPMLRPEPEKRSKAYDSLKHPWLNMPEGVEKMSEDEFKLY